MFDAKSILEGLVRNAAPPQQAQGGGGGLADIFAEILKGGGNQQQPGAGAPGGSAGGGGLGDILGEISRRMTQPGQAGSQAGEATNAVPGGGSGGLEDIFAQIQAKLNQAGGAVAGPNAGSITDILGKVLTQATQGAQEGASKIGQATGATDAMRGAVGRATGQTPGDLMQQIKDLIQQNPMMAGTVAGGLGGLLLGTRTGRSLAGTAAQAGALTLIGGLAYKAFQNYQAGRPLITGATPAEAAPQGSGFEPAAQTNNMALHYIQAMIAAAAADGRIDASEQAKIIGALKQGGVDQEAEAFLADELNNPKTAAQLAQLADSPEEALQIYTAARVAIAPDSEPEKKFLGDLARALGIDAKLAAHIEATAQSAST